MVSVIKKMRQHRLFEHFMAEEAANSSPLSGLGSWYETSDESAVSDKGLLKLCKEHVSGSDRLRPVSSNGIEQRKRERKLALQTAGGRKGKRIVARPKTSPSVPAPTPLAISDSSRHNSPSSAPRSSVFPTKHRPPSTRSPALRSPRSPANSQYKKSVQSRKPEKRTVAAKIGQKQKTGLTWKRKEKPNQYVVKRA